MSEPGADRSDPKGQNERLGGKYESVKIQSKIFPSSLFKGGQRYSLYREYLSDWISRIQVIKKAVILLSDTAFLCELLHFFFCVTNEIIERRGKLGIFL